MKGLFGTESLEQNVKLSLPHKDSISYWNSEYN